MKSPLTLACANVYVDLYEYYANNSVAVATKKPAQAGFFMGEVKSREAARPVQIPTRNPESPSNSNHRSPTKTTPARPNLTKPRLAGHRPISPSDNTPIHRIQRLRIHHLKPIFGAYLQQNTPHTVFTNRAPVNGRQIHPQSGAHETTLQTRDSFDLGRNGRHSFPLYLRPSSKDQTMTYRDSVSGSFFKPQNRTFRVRFAEIMCRRSAPH